MESFVYNVDDGFTTRVDGVGDVDLVEIVVASAIVNDDDDDGRGLETFVEEVVRRAAVGASRGLSHHFCHSDDDGVDDDDRITDSLHDHGRDEVNRRERGYAGTEGVELGHRVATQPPPPSHTLVLPAAHTLPFGW